MIKRQACLKGQHVFLILKSLYHLVNVEPLNELLAVSSMYLHGLQFILQCEDNPVENWAKLQGWGGFHFYMENALQFMVVSSMYLHGLQFILQCEDNPAEKWESFSVGVVGASTWKMQYSLYCNARIIPLRIEKSFSFGVVATSTQKMQPRDITKKINHS